MTPELDITPAHPTDTAIRPILEAHLAFTRALTPGEHVHALDLDGLTDPTVTLFGARHDGQIVGIAALRRLGPGEAELKSMHVLQTSRGRGIGRALVEHLLRVAVTHGIHRVSLETGTLPEFAPARTLYSSLGFALCDPFGDYTSNPFSTCMTLTLPIQEVTDAPDRVE